MLFFLDILPPMPKAPSSDKPDNWFKPLAAPIFTAVLGLVSGLAIASFNNSAIDTRFYREKQAVVADGIARNFAVYIENYGRMVKMRRHWADRRREPTEEEKLVFKTAVEQRNTARDALCSAFEASGLYFDEDLNALNRAFREWDEKQSTKTFDQLPEMTEWQKHRGLIVSALRDQLSR
jgi:hypothetical protein